MNDRAEAIEMLGEFVDRAFSEYDVLSTETLDCTEDIEELNTLYVALEDAQKKLKELKGD